MAKLVDQVTPPEMLEIIRDGALKNEVIKKFRTSEQELAMMLLPLYRSGTLSKEEFNDFFKGVALRKPEEPSAEKKEEEDEPPSAIFKALTDVHDRKVVEAAIKTAEETEAKEAVAKVPPRKEESPKERPKKEPAAREVEEKKPAPKTEPEPTQKAPAPDTTAAAPPPAPAPVTDVVGEPISEEVVAGEEGLVEEELLEESEIFEDLDAIAEPEIEVESIEPAEEAKVPDEPIEHGAPEPEIVPAPAPEPVADAQEVVPETPAEATASPEPPSPLAPEPISAPAPEPPVAAAVPPPPPPPAPAAAPAITTEPLLKAQGGTTIDSAGMTSFLEMIFAKLSAIENRLAQIEKKLGGS